MSILLYIYTYIYTYIHTNGYYQLGTSFSNFEIIIRTFVSYTFMLNICLFKTSYLLPLLLTIENEIGHLNILKYV